MRPGPAPPCSERSCLEPRRFRRALACRTPGSPPPAPRRRGRAARDRRRGRGHPGRARPRRRRRARRLGPAPRPAGRRRRPGGHQAAGRRPRRPRRCAAGTARAAVQRFLQAGADGDFAVAYGLLDQAGRKRYPSLARFDPGPGRPGPGHGRPGRARAHGRRRHRRRDRHPGPPGGHRPVRRAGPGAHGRGLAGQPPGRPLAGRRRPGVGPGRAARRRPRPRGGQRLGRAAARLRPAGRGRPPGRGRAVRPGRPGRAALHRAGPLDGGRPRGLRRRRRAGGLCGRLRSRGRLLGPAGAGPGPAHALLAWSSARWATPGACSAPTLSRPDERRPRARTSCPVSVLPRRIRCPSSASS